MKKQIVQLMLLAVLGFWAVACGSGSGKEDKKKEAEQFDASIAIQECLHGFFRWYEANGERVGTVQFVDDSGDYLRLNDEKLAAYLAMFKASGFVSDELVANETRFYKACAELWKNEPKDDVPSGMGADRWWCAQDYIAPYHEGIVKVETPKDGRAKAVLILSDGEYSTDFSFEMVLENGKWLIARLGCDLGVDY